MAIFRINHEEMAAETELWRQTQISLIEAGIAQATGTIVMNPEVVADRRNALNTHAYRDIAYFIGKGAAAETVNRSAAAEALRVSRDSILLPAGQLALRHQEINGEVWKHAGIKPTTRPNKVASMFDQLIRVYDPSTRIRS